MRDKRNSVIFINLEILPGPEDARICFTFFQTTMRNFNEIERSILLIMIVCEILLILILGIKINKGWDRSFKGKRIL